MKRITFLIISILIFAFAIAEEQIMDIIPSDNLWGMSKYEIGKTLYNPIDCWVGDSEALLIQNHNINGYNMDAYYVFGMDMDTYMGLSKIAYILSGQNISTEELKSCKTDLVFSLTNALNEPTTESNAVVSWETDTCTIEIGTGKFKNYTGSPNITAGVFIKGNPVANTTPTPEIDTKVYPATKLTSFYLNLNSDYTITLKALEVHDEACYIPSKYTVDGKYYTVSYIDDACFFGRTSLKVLSLPEGVKTIANNAFNSCGIRTFYFPSTLNNIYGIFEYLNHKTTIYYAGTPEQWRSIVGSKDCPSNVKVICNVPVLNTSDTINYNSASLTTEKSSAEEIGGALGNALNGFISGLLGEDD